MALVIEDGTNVAGANSYVTLLEVRAYAEARGIVLPVDDADLEPKVHLAMDWFEGQQGFQGARVFDDQPLAFPRKGVFLDGVLQPDDSIPSLAKTCVIQATCDANTMDLQPAFAGSADGSIKRKKLDVIEKEFFESTWTTRLPFLPKLQSLIEPLLSSGLGAGRLTSYRT